MNDEKVPLTPAMMVSDFAETWLAYPEDLGVLIGQKGFDTPAELGNCLIQVARRITEERLRHYESYQEYTDGRIEAIGMSLAFWWMDAIDPEELGRAVWAEYEALEEG